MPGHEGAVPGSRYRRWRVPWVGRTRAVAPCLLCEVLAVILVLRSGVALALALAWLLLRDCGSLGPPPAPLTSLKVMQRMTAEPRYWGGVSHPLQLTTGLVIKSITTSPTFGR